MVKSFGFCDGLGPEFALLLQGKNLPRALRFSVVFFSARPSLLIPRAGHALLKKGDIWFFEERKKMEEEKKGKRG